MCYNVGIFEIVEIYGKLSASKAITDLCDFAEIRFTIREFLLRIVAKFSIVFIRTPIHLYNINLLQRQIFFKKILLLFVSSKYFNVSRVSVSRRTRTLLILLEVSHDFYEVFLMSLSKYTLRTLSSR